MSDVPLWIQTLQALATPVVGVGVAVVAYMQWRTAHQKIILDLFDRRMSLYDEVVNSVTDYFGGPENTAVYTDTIQRLYHVRSKARFLFGSEVEDLVNNIRGDITKHSKLTEKREKRKPLLPSARDAMDYEFQAVLARLIDTSDRMTEACLPYLQLDQKATPTLKAWIADKNRRRLNYADEKQR